MDQVASIALFGPAGDGKSFVASTLLHDQTKARFGRNRHFMRCNLTSSLEGFLERRIPDTIDTDRTTSTAELRLHLGSPPQFILLFNGVSDIERLRRMLEYGDNTFLGMRERPWRSSRSLVRRASFIVFFYHSKISDFVCSQVLNSSSDYHMLCGQCLYRLQKMVARCGLRPKNY